MVLFQVMNATPHENSGKDLEVFCLRRQSFYQNISRTKQSSVSFALLMKRSI